MGEQTHSYTSTSLLARLRDDANDQAAWERFVDRYGPLVYGWCRRWMLQEADAKDVTQDVLLILARRMRTFEYDPTKSFRAWLKTVTKHAWHDWLADRKRQAVGSGDSAMIDLLQKVEASDDLLRHLEATFDQEVLEEASACVRARVEPRTWEAFHLLTQDGLSGADAAARLGMKVATVFVAKSKVLKMLQEEMKRLGE